MKSIFFFNRSIWSAFKCCDRLFLCISG